MWEILSLVSYYFLSSFFCSVDKKCPKVSGVCKPWGFDACHTFMQTVSGFRRMECVLNLLQSAFEVCKSYMVWIGTITTSFQHPFEFRFWEVSSRLKQLAAQTVERRQAFKNPTIKSTSAQIKVDVPPLCPKHPHRVFSPWIKAWQEDRPPQYSRLLSLSWALGKGQTRLWDKLWRFLFPHLQSGASWRRLFIGDIYPAFGSPSLGSAVLWCITKLCGSQHSAS